jgi:hypothetical protein
MIATSTMHMLGRKIIQLNYTLCRYTDRLRCGTHLEALWEDSYCWISRLTSSCSGSWSRNSWRMMWRIWLRRLPALLAGNHLFPRKKGREVEPVYTVTSQSKSIYDITLATPYCSLHDNIIRTGSSLPTCCPKDTDAYRSCLLAGRQIRRYLIMTTHVVKTGLQAEH